MQITLYVNFSELGDSKELHANVYITAMFAMFAMLQDQQHQFHHHQLHQDQGRDQDQQNQHHQQDHLSKAVENFPFTPALPGTKAASLKSNFFEIVTLSWIRWYNNT